VPSKIKPFGSGVDAPEMVSVPKHSFLRFSCRRSVPFLSVSSSSDVIVLALGKNFN
jgi:hypothetical protein